MTKNAYFIYLLLLLFSCKDTPDDSNELSISLEEGILILNEGTFTFSNASISFIKDDSVYQNIFQTQNNRSLGDVAQSITFHEDKAYIVVNNSHKIEIVDAQNFVHQKTLTGLVSPRYLLPISPTKAYISNFYQAQIDILDLTQDSIIGQIQMDCPPDIPNYECGFDKLLFAEDRLFVSDIHFPYLWIFDINSDTLIQKVILENAINDMVIDEDNFIWLASFGLENNAGKLYRLNPQTLEIAQEIEVNELGGFYKNLTIYEDVLYLAGTNKVLQFSTQEAVPPTILLEVPSLNIYGMSIAPSGDLLYLCDALDFVQRGVVFRFDLSTQSFVDTMRVGIVPSSIYHR